MYEPDKVIYIGGGNDAVTDLPTRIARCSRRRKALIRKECECFIVRTPFGF